MNKKNTENDRIIGEKQYVSLRRDFILVNTLCLSVAGIIFAYILLQHFDIIPGFPCPFHELLHLYCPGCGGTRAFFLMLQGHFIKSLYYNPAVVLGAILIIYYEMGVMITLIKKNGKYYYYRKNFLVYVYLIINLIFSIVRDYLLVAHEFDMLGDFLG